MRQPAPLPVVMVVVIMIVVIRLFLRIEIYLLSVCKICRLSEVKQTVGQVNFFIESDFFAPRGSRALFAARANLLCYTEKKWQ